MKRNEKENRRRATEGGKPAGIAGSVGIVAVKTGQSDFAGARIFTPSPCFSPPNSKCRQAHWAWGKTSNFRQQEKFPRIGKEKRDPRIILEMEQLVVAALSESSHTISVLQWRCLCFPCCSRHCLRQGGAERGLGAHAGHALWGTKGLLCSSSFRKSYLNWAQYLG